MKIISTDEERKTITLKVESADDQWYLNQVIRPGTVVGSMSMRRLDNRDDMIRPDSAPRKKMYISIKVVGTEFQPFTDVFRIMGEIVDAPPEVMGHHSINLDIGETLDIYSDYLDPSDRDLIEEAVERESGHKGYIISLDDSQCSIFRLWDNGTEEIASFEKEGGGKMYSEGGSFDQFYSDIVNDFEPVYADMKPVVVIGPSFFKKSLAKKLRDSLNNRLGKVTILDASVGGKAGLKDLVKRRGELGEVLDKVRYLQEAELVDELMAHIARGTGAAYGYRDVERALDYGAADSVMISESVFRSEEGKKLIEKASETGAKIVIVSSGHEEGVMFEEIGGIGAILRFEIG